MKKPSPITYRMEPKNLAALRVEPGRSVHDPQSDQPVSWPPDSFELAPEDPDDQSRQSHADATDCLVAAAFEAATSAAVSRRLQHGQALAVVVLVPSPAWVGPTAHHFGQTFGSRWRLVRASSMVQTGDRFGPEMAVAAELSGGQSVAGITADIGHLPRSLRLSADMTVRIGQASGALLRNAIKRFTNRRTSIEDLPDDLGSYLDLPTIVACFRPGNGPRRIAERLVAATAAAASFDRPNPESAPSPTNPPTRTQS